MKNASTVLNNLLEYLPVSTFERSVKKHKADKNVRTLRCLDMLKTLIYSQLTDMDSVRDIVSGLNTHDNELYHNGLKNIHRSTFCDALNKRPSEPFEELFQELVRRVFELNKKMKKEFGLDLKIIDSTIIDLCLNTFDWAKFRTTKGAIKIHVKIDGYSLMPEVISITTGSVSDVKELLKLGVHSGTVYTFDRGYLDYGKLNEINSNEAFFVTRFKSNSKFKVTKVINTGEEIGVISDATVKLTGANALLKYPKELRVVKFYDTENDRMYNFATNNFELSAGQIADIYKARWKIEIFFKWFKNNLNIKTFYATSENAVRTQIFVAFITFLLLALCKHRYSITQTMHRIVSTLRTTLFKRCSIADLFFPPKPRIPSTQIFLWDLG